MSTDNGVYILRTQTKGTIGPGDKGYEYRIAHCQAIENIEYPGEEDKWLIQYFGKCEIFHKEIDALKEAQRMFNQIHDEEHRIVEYGIRPINLDKEFPEQK